MTRSPLERFTGTLAVTSADLGARIALVACTELLRETGHNEAAMLLEDHGAVVIARAFSEAAWTDDHIREEMPTAGQADNSKPKSA